jgi:hypothetical protein
MTVWLKRQRHRVNVRRIRRMVRLVRLEAIYPKLRLSQFFYFKQPIPLNPRMVFLTM